MLLDLLWSSDPDLCTWQNTEILLVHKREGLTSEMLVDLVFGFWYKCVYGGQGVLSLAELSSGDPVTPPAGSVRRPEDAVALRPCSAGEY